MPCARRAFHIAGWLAASALSALPDFVRQFGGVGVVDGQALGRAQIGFSRSSWRWCVACFGVLLYRAQTLDQCSLGGGADHQRAAQRSLVRRRTVEVRETLFDIHSGLSSLPAVSQLTATDRLPFPFSLPGMYSSSTAWKLVPPKPKALSPARRTPPAGIVHGFSSVLT